MNKIEEFERVTTLSSSNQVKLINWFNRQDFVMKLEVFNEQKSQYFILKNQDHDFREILSIASFYIAINKLHKQVKMGSNKNKTMKLNKLIQSNFKPRKRKVKREKLLNIWSKIQSLKADGFSFREISVYLKSKHRLIVSHTYIRTVWMDLENA